MGETKRSVCKGCRAHFAQATCCKSFLTDRVSATLATGGAFAQSATTPELAPTGKLRFALNAGTVVLLNRTPAGNISGGVGYKVGRHIAKKLGLILELAAYPTADIYTQSFGKTNGTLD
jgi:hypothetical protein